MASALVLMTVIGFFVIGVSVQTVRNVVDGANYDSCGGIRLPELPGPPGFCSYTAPVLTVGWIVLALILALTV